jgi:hypothetical protein
MTEIRITAVSLPEGERDRAAGIVARFDFELGPFRVRDCALVQSVSGEPLATLPRCRSDRAAVRFTDHETRLQVTRAALAAYTALGGVMPAP